MAATRRSHDSDPAPLVIAAVALVCALIFGMSFDGFSAGSFLGKFHNAISQPVTLIIMAAVLVIIILMLITNSIRATKTAQSNREKLQEHQKSMLNPLRVYHISSADVEKKFTAPLREIPSRLLKLTRRGDQGIPDLVDAIMGFAISNRTSDIHMEPSPEITVVRYRQDGVLSDVGEIPTALYLRVCSRLRVLANLTIYEKGKPQDGRIEVKLDDHTFDVRISFLPTLHGDKIVIRLFESGEHQFNLKYLGLSEDGYEMLSDLLLRPQGTLFLTGPTGSGKTTTIYSSLRYILTHRGERTNIVTIEDPIEREIQGVNQTQVNLKRDLTFAAGLRSILRQDPDVIVVGEIRDRETAEICNQAGLTGHLVISTIHADSAVGVFNRLIEMQIEPFLLASSVCGIISQRLVKRNCPHCSEPAVPSLKALKILNISPTENISFMKGKGCEKCNFRGSKGRIGIYEMLIPSKKLKDAIQAKARTDELHRIAQEDGMTNLRGDGLEKVRAGILDVEELARVLV